MQGEVETVDTVLRSSYGWDARTPKFALVFCTLAPKKKERKEKT
jgi:hypothetical protein